MKKVKKRLLAIAFIITILAFFCACERVQDKTGETNSKQQVGEYGLAEYMGDYVWISIKDTYYPFIPGYIIKSAARVESTLLIAGLNGNNYALAICDYSVDPSLGIQITQSKSINLDSPYALCEKVIYSITAGTDDLFYVLTGDDPPSRIIPETGERELNPNCSGEYAILKYDTQGNYIEKIQFKYISPLSAPMRGLVVSKDGLIIVFTATEYIILNSKGDVLSVVETGDLQLIGFQLCNNGIFASCWNNGNSHHGWCTIQVLSDGSYIFTDCTEASLSSCQTIDGKYLLNTGKSFISYDFETRQRNDLIEWNYGNQMGGSCIGVCQLGDKAFAYIMANSDALHLLSSVACPKTNRSIVSVALYNTDTAKGNLLEINNSNSPYYYEYTEYGPQDIDRLIVEIASENGPDLILFNGDIDTSSNHFENLYKYIDEDPVLSRNSFLPNLLSALEVRGELHELWTGVEISTLAARVSDVGNRRGLTPEDYNQIVANNSNYCSVFQSFMTGSNLLLWIADTCSGEYIDKENGTCHFTDPSFSSMLAWCKEMAPEFTGEQASVNYDISEVVLSVERFSGATRIPIIRNNFGEAFTFVGFPCENGEGHYYSCSYGCSAAIPITSRNKHGAWEYIREQLLPEKQIGSYLIDGFPVNYDAFKRVVTPSLNEEEYAQLIELVDHTTKAINYSDQKLREIFLNSCQAYFDGDKSLEDTVKIIQSRVSIYLAEKYN